MTSLRRFGWLIASVGITVQWIGFWAPWVAHRAAGLQLNAYELADWITTLSPGTAQGSTFQKWHWLLLWTLVLWQTWAVLLPINHRWMRGIGGAAMGIASLLLLPDLATFSPTNAVHRQQTILWLVTVVGFAAIGIAWIKRKKIERIYRAGQVVLALVLVGLGWWLLGQLYPIVSTLYAAPMQLGRGWLLLQAASFLTIIGIIGKIVYGARDS